MYKACSKIEQAFFILRHYTQYSILNTQYSILNTHHFPAATPYRIASSRISRFISLIDLNLMQ